MDALRNRVLQIKSEVVTVGLRWLRDFPGLTVRNDVSSFWPQRAIALPRINIRGFLFDVMANTILVGAQWGDEGKGKIIDVLTEQADIVVRTQGGNNAGHTVFIGKQKYVLHLVPSGILRKRKTCVIGNGVVIAPIGLVEEMDGLRKLGIKV